MNNMQKTTEGYIYVMKNMGVYKIGRSNISQNRFGEYTNLPEEPVYIITEYVYDCISVEKQIHEMFNEKRTRKGCEWFRLEDKDIDLIKEYIQPYKIVPPIILLPNKYIEEELFLMRNNIYIEITE